MKTPDDAWAYFGLWSEKKLEQVSELLKSLAAEFYTSHEQLEETRLKEWEAWDPAATDPNRGYHLWIRERDREKIGTKIVDNFPERRFSREID